MIDLDTSAGEPRAECLILGCGLTAFPQQSLTQAPLFEHYPKEALLHPVLSCKESLLEQGRTKLTFLTRCQEWQL